MHIRQIVLIFILLSYISITLTQNTDEEIEIWQPKPGMTWQIQLQGNVDISYDVDVYVLDLFDTEQEIIDTLHENGQWIICYFSAGTYEDWREDASNFPESIIGEPLVFWEGENWLDIRRIDQLEPVMLSRLDLAVEKECDGVDPDNVDAYTNTTGFPLTYDDQLAYNLWLSEQAHERGLGIGLKNNLLQIEDLEPYYEWAINEQCFRYSECKLLLPFIRADKAVFVIAYDQEPLRVCPLANQVGFSMLFKTLLLDDEAPVGCDINNENND